MWGLFKKRGGEDLRKLISGYRCLLKASEQSGNNAVTRETIGRSWRGGFGKSINQLFNQWPTPNQVMEFEKKMNRWLKKMSDVEVAYVCAFNDYLGQKRLNPDELREVIQTGRSLFRA